MTFNFDFSKDKPNISEPIPVGTKLLVRMSYTPGGAGPNGALTKSKEGNAEYLKAEFTVLRGPYKGRKFWENMTVSGGKVDEKGHSIAASITRGNMRSIIDAFSGISSKDESPAACAKRVLTNGFADFQGKVFAVKVGVEPAKGSYAAKNKLGTILTIDHKDYPKNEEELDQVLPPLGSTHAKLPTVAAPAWGASAPQANNGNPAAFGAGQVTDGAHTVAATPATLVPATVPPAHVAAAATPDNGIPTWMRQAGA